MKIFQLIVCLTLAVPAFSAEVADSTDTADSTDVHYADEVVITASRYDTETRLNLSNITNAELQLRDPDRSLPMLLNGLPGVYSYSDAGSGLGYTYLKIRGFDQRRVGVMFNGIPFNDPEDHQVWWVNLADLAASVQDIQVQRGVTNSIGGMTAIGGTVNIVSLDMAAQPSGKLSLNTGSYGFSRQMLRYETGNLNGSGFSSSLRVSRQKSDGYRDRSGYEGWGVFWSGQYQTERTTTRINIYTGQEVTHHAWDAVPESLLEINRKANLETYWNAIDNFSQPHYELHNTWHLNEAWSLTNRLYYIEGEGYYENFKEDELAVDYALDRLPGVAPTDTLNVIRQKWVAKYHGGWVPQLNWEQGRGRLLMGGDWYTFHSNHWGDVLWAEGFTPADFASGSDQQPFKYHQYNGDKDNWSLYANQRYEVLSRLTLTADLQYQHKTYSFMQNEVGNFTGDLRNAYTVDYDFFNPRGSVKWRAPGGLAAYGSVGVNHREPTDNELFDTWKSGSDLGVEPLFARSETRTNSDGSTAYLEWYDPYVKEEKVVDYELGLAWQNTDFSITVGGYWMDFTDEIVPYGGVSEDGSSIRGNAGKTLHRGLELGARARIAQGQMLSLAASRSWDEFKEFIFHDWDGSVYDYSGNPIALFPDHLMMFRWDAQWPRGFRTRAQVLNTGRQQLDNTGDSSRTIDPWSTVDLSLWIDLGPLGWQAVDGASVFAHLRNIFDTEYETWGYYFGENFYTPAAGANFALGVDYDF